MAEWSIVKTPNIPDIFENVRPIVDNVFATLNILLTFLNNVLEFVKAFIIDFSNPLLLLLKEIIALVKNLLSDLLNLGIYLTTDLDLIPKVPNEGYKVFAGGYSAFEQRMVNKFTNTADTTRPVISKESAVVGIFQFAGANADSILRIINAFLQLRKLFTGIVEDTGLPQAVNLKTTLVTKFGIPFNNSKMKSPEGLKITWDLAPPSNSQDSFFPSFVIPPNAFLINVSTMPVQVGILRRSKSTQTSTDLELKAEISATLYKPQSLNNNTFLLKANPTLIQDSRLKTYTGQDTLDKVITSGDPSSYYYFFKNDQVLLPYSLIEKTNKSFYYQPYALGAFLTGNSYSLTIPYNDLPKKITYTNSLYADNISIVDKVTEDPAEELTIEVLSLNDDLGLSDGDKVENSQIYKWGSIIDNGLVTEVANVNSPITTFKIPKFDRVDYINALREALAIYILGDYINEKNYLNGQQVGVASADWKDAHLYKADKFYFFNLPTQVKSNLMAYANRPANATSLVKFNQDASDFRSDVLAVIQNIINRLPFPNTAQLDALQNNIAYLNEKRIKVNNTKLSFYDFLVKEGVYGLHGSIENIGSFGDSSKDVLSDIIDQDRIKYVKRSEVVFPTSYTSENLGLSEAKQITTIKDITLFYDLINQDLVTNARLMISSIPQKILNETGAWYSTKFFIDGFPDFTAYLNEIIAFVENLTLGLEGLIKAIKDFIEVLQKRIQEIQRIIAKLKAFIDAILNFNLDLGATVGMLFISSQGTEGLLADFLSATKKPQASTLGVGQCVVIPAPPQIVIDLFSAIFGA